MKKAIGVDLGEVRVGIAAADDLGMLAHPRETIQVDKPQTLPKQVADAAARESAKVIVLGLPRNMDGSFGPAAEKSRAFAESLRACSDCEVVLWDERMTTIAAQRSLHESGRNTKQSRQFIDQVAAQIILQSWLDSQAMLGGE